MLNDWMILLLNKDTDCSVLSSCGRLFQRDTDDGIKEFAKSGFICNDSLSFNNHLYEAYDIWK